MVWPFLTIYASDKLLLPLAAVTSLMTFNSISGFISSVIAGSLVDRFGRKGIMVIGLFGMALVYLGYIFAQDYWQFALLMFLSGAFSPLYRVGTDAIVADMIPPEDRTQAYGLIRMGRQRWRRPGTNFGWNCALPLLRHWLPLSSGRVDNFCLDHDFFPQRNVGTRRGQEPWQLARSIEGGWAGFEEQSLHPHARILHTNGNLRNADVGGIGGVRQAKLWHQRVAIFMDSNKQRPDGHFSAGGDHTDYTKAFTHQSYAGWRCFLSDRNAHGCAQRKLLGFPHSDGGDDLWRIDHCPNRHCLCCQPGAA